MKTNTTETTTEQPSLPVPETTEAESITPEGVTHTESVTLTELQTENADLKAAIRLRDARERLTKELTTKGARSPELLFDAVKGDLQFDDEGNLTNLNALMARLTGGFPEQFSRDAPVGIDGGAGRLRSPTLTKASLARMTAEEIAKLDWNEVRQVLSHS